MKKLFIHLLLAGAAALLSLGCTDDEGRNSTAQPVIKYVRSTDPSLADTYLTEGSMGAIVAIIGENLEGVVKAQFNDQAVKLNPVYITSSAIVCQIPTSMPTERNNKLTITTAKGKSCEFDFRVLIPAPLPLSISCEYAKAGTTQSITGSYFFNYEDGSLPTVTFPNDGAGLKAEVVACTSTEIKFIVPEGAEQYTGRVYVTNDYGAGKSQFYYRDAEGLFCDCEFESGTKADWDWWGFSEYGSTDGITGKYIIFTGNGAWNWPSKGMYYFSNDNSLLIPETATLSDYALRFELNARKWPDTQFLCYFNDTATPNGGGGAEAECHWKPHYSTTGNYVGAYDTDGWITATLPLSDFVYSKGDDGEIDGRVLKVKDLVSFYAMIWGYGSYDSIDDHSYEVWFDNFRIVKIK